MVGRGVYAIRCIRPLFFFSLGNYKQSGNVYWGGGWVGGDYKHWKKGSICVSLMIRSQKTIAFQTPEDSLRCMLRLL